MRLGPQFPQGAPNENRSIVILGLIFWGLGMPGKKFPSPETLKAQTLFSVSPSGGRGLPHAE